MNKRNAIENIKLFSKKHRNNHEEHGCVYDYITGKKLYCKNGVGSNVEIDMNKIENKEKHKMVVIHNHTNQGPPCFSSGDIKHLLDNDEDYMIAVSEHEFWIAEKPERKIDKEKILRELEQVKSEHINSKNDIDGYTSQKYDIFKKINDWKHNLNINLLKSDERKKGYLINNELSNKKVLEILNSYGIKTTRCIIY